MLFLARHTHYRFNCYGPSALVPPARRSRICNTCHKSLSYWLPGHCILKTPIPGCRRSAGSAFESRSYERGWYEIFCNNSGLLGVGDGATRGEETEKRTDFRSDAGLVRSNIAVAGQSRTGAYRHSAETALTNASNGTASRSFVLDTCDRLISEATKCEWPLIDYRGLSALVRGLALSTACRRRMAQHGSERKNGQHGERFD
jgi:hypothetical protein